MQSTQHYIDNEKNFISKITQPTEVIEFKTSILPMVEQIEIDVDIEKEIAQLQEAKMNQGIQKVVPVNFDSELGSFFSSITQEKEELQEKVEKEAVKISGLEDLFKELSSVKKKKVVKKKKKVLLVEPEKIEEPVIEEVVVEKTPEEVSIIDKVSKQLSEMQVATELDKDKIKSLESIDSLDKLKSEFLNFKDIVARQMGTIGGGGLNPDKVDADLIPVKTATFNLGSADKTFKDLYLSGSSLVIGGTTMVASELTVLDSVTVGTISASKAVIVDSNKDITGFRNVTMTGDLTIAGTNINDSIAAKATKAFAIAQAVALG